MRCPCVQRRGCAWGKRRLINLLSASSCTFQDQCRRDGECDARQRKADTDVDAHSQAVRLASRPAALVTATRLPVPRSVSLRYTVRRARTSACKSALAVLSSLAHDEGRGRASALLDGPGVGEPHPRGLAPARRAADARPARAG